MDKLVVPLWITFAIGDSSHAEGSHTTASGSSSHVEGQYVTAKVTAAITAGWSIIYQTR